MREMDVKFPLFAFEKDDGSMFLIEKPDRLLYHFECVDIEDEEYLFWDSTGAGVCVTVKGRAIYQILFCEQSKSLSDAFEAYSQSRGLAISLQGSPVEVWTRIQSQLPRKKSLWTRLLSR
jgi:hypothetical protein